MITGQRKFKPTPQSKARGQSDCGLGAVLQFVENRMAVGGEIVDVRERICPNLVDEELDIGSGNEGLPRAFKDDGRH
tara:strand:+ start:251 stop:481 length:231 start_codon:yes stop_codon:yes gene_type:complete